MGNVVLEVRSAIKISKIDVEELPKAFREWREAHGDFCWVVYDFWRNDTGYESLGKVRWNPEVNAVGDIVALHFKGEKYGSEQEIFKLIAPYVWPGSWVLMRTELFDVAFVFDGKTCRVVSTEMMMATGGRE